MKSTLRWISLALALLATAAPFAYVVELPHRLAQRGMAITSEGHIDTAWGFGFTLIEVAAFAASVMLARQRWQSIRSVLWPSVMAAVAYGCLLALIVVFHEPFTRIVNVWTPQNMPAQPYVYSAAFAIDHALATIFAFIALVSLICAWLAEHDHAQRTEPRR